ncbi:MAG TPA: phosphonate ABC transporter, permease protein PhnE [Dehalococcoidia bacterium]|nr:phosphonate ABC transporter, permease protein PhnE [Dehalococcoidia bacterium]
MALFSRTLKPPSQPQIPDLTALRTELLRPLPRFNAKSWVVIGLLIAAFYWGVQGTKASPAELIDGLPNIWDFIQRMFPPRFETETRVLSTPGLSILGVSLPTVSTGIDYPYPTIIKAIVETIQIAIIGTSLAIVISAPFAVLAARNIAPPPLYAVTRLLLNANRAIPDLIFALIFVAAVGLGPFGGVLALAIGSIGFMAKVYAESIEAIDPQQVLAVRATGAGRLQTIVYAVAPQAMPMIASYSLLLFESNVRSATMLGIVGAGGIGFELQKFMSLFQYRELTGALIVIIIVVTVIDRASDRIRKSIT